MEYSRASWDDLPDEIVLMIFKELDYTDVLCSFDGLNERLTRIIRDRIVVKRLTTVERISNSSLSPELFAQI